MNTLESYSIESPFGVTDTCAKFVIDDTTMPFMLNDITRVNDGYMISFWVKSEEPGNIRIYDGIFASTTEWQKYSAVFIANNTKFNIYFESTGTYYIYHPKLENGNKATDWTPAPEDLEESIDAGISDVRSSMAEQKTDIIADCKSIILSALESYVETGEYNEFKQTVSSQLEVLADRISMTFSSVSQEIGDVNEDTQTKFNELYKYITFDGENGITISSSDSAIKLIVDNDGILFIKDGVVFGSWDGTDFHTGNIVVDVNERAQFGNFAFLPNADGSLSFVKVGG